jgi:Gram-negative bacterial TonB protein C-terminal
MTTRRSTVELVFPLLFLFFFVFGPCNAQESNLDSLADQIAAATKSKAKLIQLKVIVIDFPEGNFGVDSLSSYLADAVSAKLSSRLPAEDIVPRSKLVDVLASYRLSPLDLRSLSTAYWAAGKSGANIVVAGQRSDAGDAATLDVKLLRVGDAKEIASWNVNLPLDSNMSAERNKSLNLPPNSLHFGLRCRDGDPILISHEFVNAGGILPKGISMPNPPYSEEARKEKMSGSRSYDAFIDETGKTFLVIPHRPLRPYFDDIAVPTILRWRFKPATQNGQPVAVCMALEVTWRLY